MNIIKSISISALCLGVFACVAAQSTAYTVTIPLSEDEDGLKAYIVDYDSSKKIDSTIVEGDKAVFKGNIASPRFVQLVIDGSRAGAFILEPGDITADIKNRTFTGTPLNEKFIEFSRNMGQIVSKYRVAASDTSAQAKASLPGIQQEYQNYTTTTMKANAGNPLGYYLFINEAYEMSLPELDKALAENPAYASSIRINNLRKNLLKKEETSVGKQMKDFTIIQPDGTKKSLSDYVGKGKYTLVDFWASWCGPCIRETKVIKELYNRYNSKGLDILGVAVWDEVPNTLKAIETHQLPWPQILDAKTVPTDLYGISGIPCIILFDPEGKIVSRDKQDTALVADVEKALEEYSAAQQ